MSATHTRGELLAAASRLKVLLLKAESLLLSDIPYANRAVIIHCDFLSVWLYRRPEWSARPRWQSGTLWLRARALWFGVVLRFRFSGKVRREYP